MGGKDALPTCFLPYCAQPFAEAFRGQGAVKIGKVSKGEQLPVAQQYEVVDPKEDDLVEVADGFECGQVFVWLSQIRPLAPRLDGEQHQFQAEGCGKYGSGDGVDAIVIKGFQKDALAYHTGQKVKQEQTRGPDRTPML